MKTLLKYTFTILALCAIVPLSAQKFGYVDSQELVQAIPEVNEANSNIETFKTQLQKRGQEMLQALQVKYQELERKQAQGAISPKELEVEGQKLKAEEQEIYKFEQESQQKIMKKSEDLLAPIRDKIQNAIDQVAAENGYDYIFDYATGFLLFADSSADVSDLVKAKLGI